jgi:hypothetical protein
MIQQFISEYGTTIMYTVITAIFGFLGIAVKNLCNKYLNDKTKKAVAKSCVQFVEQVYKDLHGPEKLEIALTSAREMLAEKGIECTELEMRVLIEAALASFNDAFKEGGAEVPKIIE